MSVGRVRELKEGLMQRKGNINNWNAYSLTTQLKAIRMDSEIHVE